MLNRMWLLNSVSFWHCYFSVIEVCHKRYKYIDISAVLFHLTLLKRTVNKKTEKNDSVSNRKYKNAETKERKQRNY